ncbi:MAG: hypothetical protein QOF00_2474 [Pseudonocardiales bacterium]|jgi:hypothetical protein|nr:hypothetical protein [Pseudonocardiales bacterium]
MTADASGAGAPRFDVVLRGYDRRQVDEHVARLQRVMSRMRADLELVRSQPIPVVPPPPPGYGGPGPGQQYGQPPGRPPRPTPRPHPGGDQPDMIGSFTDRMQSILQAAEEEAAEIRNKARSAARAESESVRAELAELVRRRDAVRTELTRLRGQLEGLLGAPTAMMAVSPRESAPSPGRPREGAAPVPTPGGRAPSPSGGPAPQGAGPTGSAPQAPKPAPSQAAAQDRPAGPAPAPKPSPRPGPAPAGQPKPPGPQGGPGPQNPQQSGPQNVGQKPGGQQKSGQQNGAPHAGGGANATVAARSVAAPVPPITKQPTPNGAVPGKPVPGQNGASRPSSGPSGSGSPNGSAAGGAVSKGVSNAADQRSQGSTAGAANPASGEPGKASHRLPTGAMPAVSQSSSMRPRSEPDPEPADLFRPQPGQKGRAEPEPGPSGRPAQGSAKDAGAKRPGDVEVTVKVGSVRPSSPSDATVLSPVTPPKKDAPKNGAAEPERPGTEESGGPDRANRSASTSRSG